MNKELIIVQTFDELGFVTGYVIKGELVRCKYCKHWKREENQNGEIGDDYFCAFDQNKSYREDFYCADGKRRKEPEKETKTDHWGYERLFCPNCKAQYTKGQRYCDNCGQKLI